MIRIRGEVLQQARLGFGQYMSRRELIISNISMNVSHPHPHPIYAFMYTTLSVYRINWLRARAKKIRWEEEIELIPKEMEWTVLFFKHKAEEWQSLVDIAGTSGQRSYAERQRAMWTGLQYKTTESFNICRAQNRPVDDVFDS
jgi:hypothetical protein